MNSAMKPSERDNLAAHVDLCGQRYGEIRTRLMRLEVWLGAITLLLLIGEGTVTDVVRRLIGV